MVKSINFLYCIICIISFPVYGFKLGVENISTTFLKKLSPDKQLKIGLITNQTGCDQYGNRTIDILLQKGIHISFIGAPEHGLTGMLPAATQVKNDKDAKTGIPILSLYNGHTGTALSPDTLKSVDAIFFDIQDAGMRHYTYISTLLLVLQAVYKAGKTLVVLDRPNPLGTVMEGPLVESPQTSFISVAKIPLRHGMTVGELAFFFNTTVLPQPALLYVVPMKGYDRTHGIGTTLIAALSPNITNKDAVYGYSFLGLLGEIRPFDVGLGTEHPFSVIGLPVNEKISKEKWQGFALQLKDCGISAHIHSYYSSRKKKQLMGLKLHMPNINAVRAFDAFLATVQFAKKNGITTQFSDQFDKAAGTALVRNYLSGALSENAFEMMLKSDLKTFISKATHSFYYSPSPQL